MPDSLTSQCLSHSRCSLTRSELWERSTRVWWYRFHSCSANTFTITYGPLTRTISCREWSHVQDQRWTLIFSLPMNGKQPSTIAISSHSTLSSTSSSKSLDSSLATWVIGTYVLHCTISKQCSCYCVLVLAILKTKVTFSWHSCMTDFHSKRFKPSSSRVITLLDLRQTCVKKQTKTRIHSWRQITKRCRDSRWLTTG